MEKDDCANRIISLVSPRCSCNTSREELIWDPFLFFRHVSSIPSFFSELGSNPLKTAGIEAGAFADLKRVSYIRIADTNITEVPKGIVLIYYHK